MGQPLNEPYYVAMVIENNRCKGLRMLENAGIKKYSLVDINGSPKGLTQNLIKMPPEDIKNLLKKLHSCVFIFQERLLQLGLILVVAMHVKSYLPIVHFLYLQGILKHMKSFIALWQQIRKLRFF